jgi:hypothetical protein
MVAPVSRKYHSRVRFSRCFPTAPATEGNAMKNMTGFAVMAAMAGTVLYGASAGPMNDREVTVCMENSGEVRMVPLAQMTATKMFGGIGVKIHWRARTTDCPSEGIVISLSERTPATLKPGALAYAKPYEGTHIVLFYDRIVQFYGSVRVAPLLSHVLVHEITHILQGTVRHSENGVMKAHWTWIDYAQMACKPMRFDRDDVDLVHAGLRVRARRAMLAPGNICGRIAAGID